ncbi:hepatic triacylglycerol lipase-like [Tachysurus fulvidraco]|uniref:hepatic triacylglycerol lipase-like n=1 Tax=Tachysurus fulvidraco TaxID=1234273 RepID=UPI001FEDA7AB|nr:hepatic triacylglycerol lipase-like [Tachysurus fulvidraco]
MHRLASNIYSFACSLWSHHTDMFLLKIQSGEPHTALSALEHTLLSLKVLRKLTVNGFVEPHQNTELVVVMWAKLMPAERNWRRSSSSTLKSVCVCVCDSADGVGLNLTNTFLIFTEEDIGELLKIRLTWESPTESFSAVWKHIKSFWSTSSSTKVLQVRRIRIKCGESQRKFTFCAEDMAVTDITPGKSVTFVKCRDGWEVKPRKRIQG